MSLALLLAVALNDSAVLGVGGTVTALEDKTPVRMVSEHVKVDFGSRTVEAEFVFRNGSATAEQVLMGFPEEGSGDIQPPSGERGSYFESFQSWVDGQPAKTELWKAEASVEEQFYKQWWTKTVSFAPGQTRRVRNLYRTRYSSDTVAHRRLYYVLGTGKPWAGTIGSAKVVFDVSAVRKGALMVSDPPHHRRSGDSLVWEFKDFEPQDVTFAVNVGELLDHPNWKVGEGVEPGIGLVFRR